MKKAKDAMQDRNSLLAAMSKQFGRTPPPAPAATAGPSGAYPVPPSRQTRKAVTTWQDEIALKQLKQLSAEAEKSQQALLAEALNLLFAKYGKPPIAS